jgi:polar amino acid transport system substrate-binding protein
MSGNLLLKYTSSNSYLPFATMLKPKVILLPLIACLIGLLSLPAAGAAGSSPKDSNSATVLRWGCDPEGAPPYPYYELSSDGKEHIIGFEVDFAEALAEQLGKKAEMIKHDWDTIIPGLSRGLYDVVINGIVYSDKKLDTVNFSVPYYLTHAQLIIKNSTHDIQSLEDCHNKVIGIFKSNEIFEILEDYPNIQVRQYENEINIISDLINGRIEAALLDNVASIYAVATNPEISLVGKPIGKMAYVVALPKDQPELLAQVNRAISNMIQTGELKTILERWNIWNSLMAYYTQDFSGPSTQPTRYEQAVQSRQQLSHGVDQSWIQRYKSFLPLLTQSAWVTLKISICAMLLATVAGFLLAILRFYGPWPIRLVVASFIELIRGTPLLIQLLFIFYGLSNIGINLDPFVAGVLGLGINYTAFEAENYRAGLMAVPRGQLEAARALGMSHFEALRHVIIPQAFTTVIPPVTNDFISLLKDSSLVSMITIVELTKTYTMLAFTYYDFFGIGILVALIYLLIGLPFVRFARLAEKHLDTDRKRYKKTDISFAR